MTIVLPEPQPSRAEEVVAGTQSAATVIAADPGDLDAARLDLATVRERTSLVSRIVTVVAVVVPAGGILSAAGLLWGVAFEPLDLVLFLALYVLTGLGITVGYHRYFTHRSFEAGPVVKVSLAILGAMTLQGPLTQWVTDHRKHHARSDAEGDPHSPHLAGAGFVGAVKGLWHAHMGWMFSTKGMERGEVYGRDLFEDRTIRLIDRLYVVWVAISIGLPFLIGYAVTGSAARGVEAMVWAGLVRIFAFEHATFAVNSICHTFGRRTYEARDQSRNNWFVAVLTFGEGWHNNHHAFPRSARHGLQGLQLDVSWIVIRALERCHLARNIRVPTTAQLARAVRAGATAA
ncbi:MAG: Stearoyl-CoA 9-desaturase [Acidimicrobiaceae bacterium]|nr:Stearoyl-CoA 9-desaturase [Acidimicrobiaceae bacterium]